MKSLLRFLKNNLIYLLWFLVNFSLCFVLLGMNRESFFVSLIIYGFSISLALSPIGEFILQFLESARKLETQQQKDYLLPLLEEVYEQARQFYPNLPKIKLCIVSDMSVNAFAIGRHTIAINQGAIEALNAQELQAIMAHELGHIIHGHTKALLLNVVGNGIFTFFIFLIQISLFINKFIALIFSNSSFILLFFTFIEFVLRLCITLFSIIGAIILSINTRNNEFQADNFALECGFGEQLVQCLYFLQKMVLNDKKNVLERLTCSHPHINKRIERLEAIL